MRPAGPCRVMSETGCRWLDSLPKAVPRDGTGTRFCLSQEEDRDRHDGQMYSGASGGEVSSHSGWIEQWHCLQTSRLVGGLLPQAFLQSGQVSPSALCCWHCVHNEPSTRQHGSVLSAGVQLPQSPHTEQCWHFQLFCGMALTAGRRQYVWKPLSQASQTSILSSSPGCLQF